MGGFGRSHRPVSTWRLGSPLSFLGERVPRLVFGEGGWLGGCRRRLRRPSQPAWLPPTVVRHDRGHGGPLDGYSISTLGVGGVATFVALERLI
jgi:hypothetical protein